MTHMPDTSPACESWQDSNGAMASIDMSNLAQHATFAKSSHSSSRNMMT